MVLRPERIGELTEEIAALLPEAIARGKTTHESNCRWVAFIIAIYDYAIRMLELDPQPSDAVKSRLELLKLRIPKQSPPGPRRPPQSLDQTFPDNPEQKIIECFG